MTTESLTYSELADRLGTSPEAARSLTRRLRLPRKPGNDGKVRIIVDLAEIQYTPFASRSPRTQTPDIGALNAQIERMQAELATLEVEKNCLEASVAGARADFERERDRCDTLMAETLALTKVAMSAREKAARLEGETSARRGRRWWGQLTAHVARTHGGQPKCQWPLRRYPLVSERKNRFTSVATRILMLASRVNDPNHLRERAAEMRASSKELKGDESGHHAAAPSVEAVAGGVGAL